MRLINTQSLQLQTFGFNAPPYAILSHRWGPPEQEVSFQDYMEGRKKHTPGYQKIVRCCALALSRGHEWAWIDTCCIDKESSAELSEAINLMFHWNFAGSEWFTRGWTLQELLAPCNVIFLTAKWRVFGCKSYPKAGEHLKYLGRVISHTTGIPEYVLSNPAEFRRYSVAQRMSWAANCETSRVEDTAYCLLGIFEVNMPLLYGERSRAFIRLQKEIFTSIDDESMFA